MKVARYRALGGPEHIEVAEQPPPSPAPGQLLVHVHATSVNPVDWKMASGAFPFNIMPPALPYVPGFDVAGEVAHAAGDFAVGDRVFVRKTERAGGASAELAVCDAAVAAKMPAGMSFHDAAAIPLAGMTALQGLRDGARLPLSGADGWRVLIVGASGGVGHFATQIARDAGAHVTGVCSARNAAFVTSLGAHAVIDYARDDAWDAAGGFDVILDCVGGKPVSRFTPLLTARGAYACVMPDAGVFARQFVSALVGPRVRAVMLTPRAADLRALAEMYARGALRAELDAVLPLDALAEAHRRSIAGRARGKIVVAVR